jgi:xylulokinase
MFIIIYDFGTTSLKTCLFEIGSEIEIAASSSAGYGLYITEDGGAEQDTEEWWAALCSTTRGLLKRIGCKARKDRRDSVLFADAGGGFCR